MPCSCPSSPRSDCYDKPVWTLRSLAAVLPSMPRHLRQVLPTIYDRPITGRLREMIMLAVAAENRCWYCQTAHGVFGRATGLTAGEVDALLAGDDATFDEPVRAALLFARDLARRGFRSRDEALHDALQQHFAPAQCRAIEATAHVMNFANRFGNTFDAARARLAGRRDCTGASGLDVAIVSALFLPAAAAVSPWVGALMAVQRLGLERR